MTTALLDAPATVPTTLDGVAMLTSVDVRTGRCAVRRAGGGWAEAIPAGSILVADRIDASMLDLAFDAAAIIVEAAPEHSGLGGGHLDAVLYSLDIPIVCGVANASDHLYDDALVSVATRGRTGHVEVQAQPKPVEA